MPVLLFSYNQLISSYGKRLIVAKLGKILNDNDNDLFIHVFFCR